MAAQKLRDISLELMRRPIDALSLYRPFPKGVDFHKSQARTNILDGSNRSGKTMHAAADFAMAVRGMHPWRVGLPKKNGIAYAVGFNLDHVGSVMWKKLTDPGAFRILFDPVTREWRSARSWDDYPELWKPSGPLIPDSEIEQVAWENAAASVPKRVKMKNGWVINFYSSQSRPPQGFAANLIWFDEEIANSEWYSEVAVRGTVDFKGYFTWSATPQNGGMALHTLYMRALNPDMPQFARFQLLQAENPILSPEQKADFFNNLLDDRDRDVRWYGKYAISQQAVYPEFSENRHIVDPVDLPDDWCRYMYVDPGYQVCAALFFAVPPDQSEVHVYDELYIRNCDAAMFGSSVKAKTDGKSFYDFVIDIHGAKLTHSGTGTRPLEHYREALLNNGVSCEARGSSFGAGSDNIESRTQSLRKWLTKTNYKNDGPYLRIHRNCKNLIHEIQVQLYQKKDGLVTDKRINKDNHAVWCLEAAADRQLPYHKPTIKKNGMDIVDRLKRKMRRKNGERRNFVKLG